MLVLQHEDSNKTEWLPYLSTLFSPVQVIEFWGRAAKRDPPCKPEACVWHWWKECRNMKLVKSTTEMYLIYCTVTEEEMREQRIQNQPIPAGRLDTRLEPSEAREEVHVTMCICIKVQHCGIACHTVHLRKHPCASILVLFRASRPSRARASLLPGNRVR